LIQQHSNIREMSGLQSQTFKLGTIPGIERKKHCPSNYRKVKQRSRIMYLDPDATDSSSDEGHRRCKNSSRRRIFDLNGLWYTENTSCKSLLSWAIPLVFTTSSLLGSKGLHSVLEVLLPENNKTQQITLSNAKGRSKISFEKPMKQNSILGHGQLKTCKFKLIIRIHLQWGKNWKPYQRKIILVLCFLMNCFIRRTTINNCREERAYDWKRRSNGGLAKAASKNGEEREGLRVK